MDRLTNFVTNAGFCVTGHNTMKHYHPCIVCRDKATITNGRSEKFNFCDTCVLKELFLKLKDYEDAEEKKALLKAPPRVGDVAYVIDKNPKTGKLSIFMGSWDVVSFRVLKCGEIEIHGQITYKIQDIFYDDERLIPHCVYVGQAGTKVGEVVFLTYEEAKQALDTNFKQRELFNMIDLLNCISKNKNKEEKKMKKLFISQPMKGKGDQEILDERERAIKEAEEKLGEKVEVVDSFFQAAPADAKPLWFLGKSLELLSTADVAYFATGWQEARECRIEHEAAVQYGIKVINEI